jgi:hypothetical protein
VDTFQKQTGNIASTKPYSLDSRELKEDRGAAIGLTNNVTRASFFLDK